jgi:hypothetical protein
VPPLDVASGGGSLSPRRCCALLSESPGAPRDVASGRTGGAFTTCSARLALLRRLHTMHGPPRLARPLALLVSAPGAPFDEASGRTGGAFTTCSARLVLLATAPPAAPPGTSPPECDMASAPEAFYIWPFPRPPVVVGDTPLRRSQGEPGPWDHGTGRVSG